MKRNKFILGFISAVAIATGVTGVASAGMIGDIDNNGTLSPRDALIVLKSVAGREIDASYDVSVETADITGDGIVNASDALYILKEVAGTKYSDPETPYKEPFSGTVFIFGDSIADNNWNNTHFQRPTYGWGMVFDEYFNDNFVKRNYAIRSESSKSYLLNNQYQYHYYIDKIVEDDYVFVAFGHNDHTAATPIDGMHGVDRRTPLGDKNTEGTFQWHLKTYYIDPVLERGAVPILLTPVCRATFDENGKFTETQVHLDYGKAIVDLVAEYQAEGKNVYLVDTQKYTYDLYTSLSEQEGGKEEIMSYHALSDAGWFDDTHFCEKGARSLSTYIIETLKSYNLDIIRYLDPQWDTK